MKSLIFIASLVSTSFAYATSGTLNIKPMHCGSCVKNVNKTICKNAEMESWFESCKAELVDADKEEGKVEFTLKKDVKWDDEKKAKIAAALKPAGRAVISENVK
jgi:copper chaperone CopZ